MWLTVTDVSLDCPSPTPPAAASLNCWVPVTTLSKPGLGLCGTAGCGSFHLASLRPSQHTSEPRLYRKTFLLRKRGSQPKLQASSVPAIPGKCRTTKESWVHTTTLLDILIHIVNAINALLCYLYLLYQSTNFMFILCTFLLNGNAHVANFLCHHFAENVISNIARQYQEIL